ncbi:response regulator [Bradyrhizobium canariense]|uniref:Response regulator n=1 Tax=Bradyrhizobium canariense TaxID=255045 RepID=A0ABX3XB66_9BRAD|nr:response regulator [Bradyrhizobium canariense]OSJ19668.1 response regulator [Bradyrhizobium canariense]OSJ35599.1 response regulator [Bradyrhizobium canariense]
MMVLIVEDDDHKLNDLQEFISETFAVDDVRTARSFQSGIRSILEFHPDFVFLDMTMRNFDRTLSEEGGRPHPFAGREILRQMQRNRITTPVLVVTQFDRFGEESDYMTLDELVAELSAKFSNYVGTVHYRSNVDDWKPSILQSVGGSLPRRQP